MIPIISDIKIVYKQIDELSESNSSSTTTTNSSFDINNDITIENFKVQIKKLNKLEEDLKWDKLQKIHKTEDKSNYNIYVAELYKLIASFKLDDKPGYKTFINKDSKLLRQHNIDGLNWELRRGLSGYYYTLYNPTESYSDNIEHIEVHKGEQINIVGFFKIPFMADKIYDVLNSNDISHRFGKIGNITKIETGENTIISCNNHGLTKDEFIYIEDSNSKPHINKTYQISEIIDNNKFTIPTGITKGTNGTHGILYSSLKLSYKIHNIVKVQNSFKLQTEKKIINESKNRLVGDVYLLENNINENEYIQVLKYIIPNYFEIINSLNPTKLDIKYLDDIDKYISKYNFHLYDLNIKELNIFKTILKDVLDKTDKLTKSESKKLNKLNKENEISHLFNNKTTDIYKNEYITHSDIIAYYGNYPLLKTEFDTIEHRINWISKSPDNGQLYYDIVLSKIYNDIISSYKLSNLKEQIKTINKDYNHITSEYEKEKKIVKYAESDPCDIYKHTIYPTYTSLEDLKKDTTDDDINKKALIINESGRSLYIYNGTEWMKDNTPVNYDNIENICNFDNIDIDKVDLSKLHCIYLSSQCKNKKLHRLDQKKKRLEENKKDIDSLIELLVDNNFKKIIEKKINGSKAYLQRFKGLSEIYESKGGAKSKDKSNDKPTDKPINKSTDKSSNKSTDKSTDKFKNEDNSSNKSSDKSKNEDKPSNKPTDKSIDKSIDKSKDNKQINEEDNNDSVISIKKYIDNNNISSNNGNNNASVNDSSKYDKMLNLIFKINNINERSYYIYDLIERDGLLINNNIYSKTFKKLIVCGHWTYTYKLSKITNSDERDIVLNELYGIYSDNGEETSNIHRCKICSQVLGTIEYDDFDGATDDLGNLAQSRAIWVDDKPDTTYKIDCTSRIFKEKLGLRGITSLQNVNKSVEICKYISDITNNIGVELSEEDIININIDCLGKILDLISEDTYKLSEIKKLKEKGWDVERIKRLLSDKEKLHNSYKKYIIVNKLSIISARILITLQSAIPGYKITNPTSACAYNGIEDEKGFEYISCILVALKLFSAFFHKKNKDETTLYIKSTIEKKYQSFKNDKNIRKMLYKKQDYLDKIKNKVKQTKQITKYEIDDSVTLPDNFPDAIKKQEKIINSYRIVSLNTAKQINKLVGDYINKQTPIESGLTETSCCYMKKDNNFYTDIKNYYTNIDELITQSYNIYKYEYLILRNGFYSRFNNEITYRYRGAPTFTYKIKDTDNDIIQNKFLYYCYSGEFIGEEHNYIGLGKMKKCTKCNMSYKNILDKAYSYKDYEKLIENIGLKTIKNDSERKILENQDIINEYNNTNAINNITSLFKILNNYNHKKDIINSEYLINLGNYSNIYDKAQFKNDKDRILNEEKRNNKRIELIKKYINQFFRKYVSMCKNNQFVPLSHTLYEKNEYEKTYDKMDDILEILKKDNNKLVDYGINHNEIFKNIKFTLTNNEVNSICFIPNKYDKSYKTIIKESQFTADDAINTLLNILTTNLLGFYKNIPGDPKENNRIISLFILDVFDEINKETNIINIRNKENVSDLSNDSSFSEIETQDNIEKFDVNEEDNIEEQQKEQEEQEVIIPHIEVTDDSLDSGYDYGDMPQGTEEE